MKNYLVGYGSLISKESRLNTGVSDKCIPIKVSGFRREWNVIIPEEGATYLGVVRDSENYFNGVLFEVFEDEIAKFDKRETEYYERILIDKKYIKFLNIQIDLYETMIWIYISKNPSRPNSEYPVINSYVNTVLNGVLNLGKDFYDEFIRTTFGLDFIYDDLDNPRYPYLVKDEEMLLNKEILDKDIKRGEKWK